MSDPLLTENELADIDSIIDCDVDDQSEQSSRKVYTARSNNYRSNSAKNKNHNNNNNKRSRKMLRSSSHRATANLRCESAVNLQQRRKSKNAFNFKPTRNQSHKKNLLHNRHHHNNNNSNSSKSNHNLNHNKNNHNNHNHNANKKKNYANWGMKNHSTQELLQRIHEIKKKLRTTEDENVLIKTEKRRMERELKKNETYLARIFQTVSSSELVKCKNQERKENVESIEWMLNHQLAMNFQAMNNVTTSTKKTHNNASLSSNKFSSIELLKFLSITHKNNIKLKKRIDVFEQAAHILAQADQYEQRMTALRETISGLELELRESQQHNERLCTEIRDGHDAMDEERAENQRNLDRDAEARAMELLQKADDEYTQNITLLETEHKNGLREIQGQCERANEKIFEYEDSVVPKLNETQVENEREIARLNAQNGANVAKLAELEQAVANAVQTEMAIETKNKTVILKFQAKITTIEQLLAHKMENFKILETQLSMQQVFIQELKSILISTKKQAVIRSASGMNSEENSVANVNANDVVEEPQSELHSRSQSESEAEADVNVVNIILDMCLKFENWFQKISDVAFIHETESTTNTNKNEKSSSSSDNDGNADENDDENDENDGDDDDNDNDSDHENNSSKKQCEIAEQRMHRHVKSLSKKAFEALQRIIVEYRQREEQLQQQQRQIEAQANRKEIETQTDAQIEPEAEEEEEKEEEQELGNDRDGDRDVDAEREEEERFQINQIQQITSVLLQYSSMSASASACASVRVAVASEVAEAKEKEQQSTDTNTANTGSVDDEDELQTTVPNHDKQQEVQPQKSSVAATVAFARDNVTDDELTDDDNISERADANGLHLQNIDFDEDETVQKIVHIKNQTIILGTSQLLPRSISPSSPHFELIDDTGDLMMHSIESDATSISLFAACREIQYQQSQTVSRQQSATPSQRIKL